MLNNLVCMSVLTHDHDQATPCNLPPNAYHQEWAGVTGGSGRAIAMHGFNLATRSESSRQPDQTHFLNVFMHCIIIMLEMHS